MVNLKTLEMVRKTIRARGHLKEVLRAHLRVFPRARPVRLHRHRAKSGNGWGIGKTYTASPQGSKLAGRFVFLGD